MRLGCTHIARKTFNNDSNVLSARTFGVSAQGQDLLQVTRKLCYTELVSSTRRLRNVTVTLEEDVAQWARIEAARQDTSVSRLLGALLKERMSARDDYEKVMRRALGRKPFLRSDGRYLTREEAHDRARTR